LCKHQKIIRVAFCEIFTAGHIMVKSSHTLIFTDGQLVYRITVSYAGFRLVSS